MVFSASNGVILYFYYKFSIATTIAIEGHVANASRIYRHNIRIFTYETALDKFNSVFSHQSSVSQIRKHSKSADLQQISKSGFRSRSSSKSSRLLLVTKARSQISFWG